MRNNERERELIINTQGENQINRDEAYMELLELYKDSILKAGQSSGYIEIVGPEKALEFGIDIFKRIVDGFDLNRKCHPYSVIYRMLVELMIKQKYIDSGESYLSPELKRKFSIIETALRSLKSDECPTKEEIHRFIREHLRFHIVKLRDIEEYDKERGIELYEPTPKQKVSDIELQIDELNDEIEDLEAKFELEMTSFVDKNFIYGFISRVEENYHIDDESLRVIIDELITEQKKLLNLVRYVELHVELSKLVNKREEVDKCPK